MDAQQSQQEFVANFRHLLTSDGGMPVRLLETHISFILLTGKRAYKIKKAIKLPFLDYTSLSARKQYCEEEIRLNRRYAPSLYLGVAALGGTPPHIIADAGVATEFAVEMNEFPQEMLFEGLAARHELSNDHIDRLAIKLAQFHGGCARAISVGAGDTPDASIAVQSANLLELRALLKQRTEKSQLASIERWMKEQQTYCAALFAERRRRGMVRECHGDLHLGNIVLIGNEPTFFDGIEFAPELRWIDVIAEAAFTAMDLAVRAGPPLAWRFINAYLSTTGDYRGMALLPLFCVHWALVRAKVLLLRECECKQTESVHPSWRDYFAQAVDLSTARKPTLVIMHGLSGSGKSHASEWIAEDFGAIRIRSDVERKRMAGLSELATSGSGIDCGIYSAENTDHVYTCLLESVTSMLQAGMNVVVDAAFLEHGQRLRFHNLASSLDCRFAIIHAHADKALLEARLTTRGLEHHDASEANLQVLQRQCHSYEPLHAEEIRHAVDFDSSSQDRTQRQHLLQALNAALAA